MWRSLASNALTLGILMALVLGGVIAWGQREYAKDGPLAAAICLKVDRGSSMRRVSQNLAEQGAISDARIFRIGADYSEKSGQLKAGSFLVPDGASMEEIVDLVTRGGQSTCGTEVNYRIGVNTAEMVVRELDPDTERFVEKAAFKPGVDEVPEVYSDVRDQADVRFRVTLAEGVTSWQIVEALKRADFVEGEVENIPQEGSLAPDSYEVAKGVALPELLDRMRSAQQERLAAAWAARADGLPLETLEEAMVLASIVEKETGVAEERGQVASVFINRLNQGMRLQTDPTVIYGITRGKGILGRGLRQSELRKDTPWNTYTRDGLPPSPIANPGLDAIEAALNPDSTPYLFFVADGTGGHAFAETLAEHNENVARWRKIEAERADQ